MHLPVDAVHVYTGRCFSDFPEYHEGSIYNIYAFHAHVGTNIRLVYCCVNVDHWVFNRHMVKDTVCNVTYCRGGQIQQLQEVLCGPFLFCIIASPVYDIQRIAPSGDGYPSTAPVCPVRDRVNKTHSFQGRYEGCREVWREASSRQSTRRRAR